MISEGIHFSEPQLTLYNYFSAKTLIKGEPNVSYICSRYYRAPELIFGATHYTTAIGNTKLISNEKPIFESISHHSTNDNHHHLTFPLTDLWSAGCVIAELLLGTPLFPGDSGIDQLVEIIKILGTPTREEVHAMNPNYTEYKFPQIKGQPWNKVHLKKNFFSPPFFFSFPFFFYYSFST